MKNTLTTLFTILSLTAIAQSNWQSGISYNFGGTITYIIGKGQTFPGLRFFAGVSAHTVYKEHFVANYGPSLAVYTKGLGANLNPLVNDIQVDFVNTIGFGYTWGDTLGYSKYFRTLGNASYYNVELQQEYAAMLSTNFILNNHKHHQANGAITFSSPHFTLNYYNDGGFPFDRMPIADGMDRYWTGGLGIFIHTDENYNSVEFTFDQFTGYIPLLYEVATKIGIDVPDYALDSSSRRKIAPEYNTSAYNLRICPERGLGIDIGAIGALRSGNGRLWGVQDIIHKGLGYALHPNKDETRFYFGATYNNNFNHVTIK